MKTLSFTILCTLLLVFGVNKPSTNLVELAKSNNRLLQMNNETIKNQEYEKDNRSFQTVYDVDHTSSGSNIRIYAH